MKAYFKKTIAASVLIVLMFAAYSFQSVNSYTVTGNITGLADGIVLELLPAATHKDEAPVATAVVKKGTFEFKGTLSSPRLYFVKVASSEYDGFQLMIENGMIEVAGTANQEMENGRKRWKFGEVNVTGSPAHEAFLQKTSLRSRLNKVYEENEKRNREINSQLEAARNKKDTELEKKLMAGDAYKRMETDEANFFKLAEDSFRDLILDNKNSWWGPFLMLHEMTYLRPEDKSVFEQFSTEAKESYYGKLVSAELFPVSLVGKAAPSLAFVDQTGKSVDFSSIAKGKKYVVIDFWASWCQPCRKAVPALKQFYGQHKNNVEIISVSIDKSRDLWLKANKDESFPWHSYLDEQGIANAYAVKAIPAMFLLDAKGNVVAEQVSLDQIREKIK